jgi:hypothetical protein
LQTISTALLLEHIARLTVNRPILFSSSPKVGNVSKVNDWQIYRTRFLVKGKQLTEPLAFVDPLGREHCGIAGDYLVEWSDGLRRIVPRELFEDAYVAMGPADENWLALTRRKPPVSTTNYQAVPAAAGFVIACES